MLALLIIADGISVNEGNTAPIYSLIVMLNMKKRPENSDTKKVSQDIGVLTKI